MSIAGTLAQPQTIEIEGRGKVKLYPMSLYELGLCETAFHAYMTRQALITTIGLGEDERQQALDRAAVYCSALEVDLTPLTDWITGTLEGVCTALSVSMSDSHGKQIPPREAGRWAEASGGFAPGSGTPVEKWLIDSQLRPDPTDPESEKEETTRDQSEAEPSEPSTEPSSDGGSTTS